MYSRLFLSLLLICAMATTASAYTLDDVQWDTSIDSATLHWGDSVEDNGYTITAEDFDEDDDSNKYVYITIERDGKILEHGFLDTNFGLEYRDTEKGNDIKIIAEEINIEFDSWTGEMEDPTAKIKVQQRGLPEFDIDIETDEDEYDPKHTSETEIDVTFKVKNDGAAKAEDVIINIDSAGMDAINGDLTKTVSSLKVGEITEEYTVTLETPHLWDETDLEIIATAEGYDINEELHIDNNSKTVTIAPKVELQVVKIVGTQRSFEKIAQNETSINDDDPEKMVIDMEDSAYVSVVIRNDGLYDIEDITVKDKVFEHMELLDDINLEKNISLEAGETLRLFEYTMHPIKTGTYTFPSAIASFTASNGETYEYESNEQKIEINGPDIDITQDIGSSTIRPLDEVEVTVKVSNKGTRDAHVNSSSSIPDNLTFLRGDTGLEKVIKKGDTATYSYTISASSAGTYEIPPVKADFVDLTSYKGERVSNILQFNVTNTSTQDTATDTSNKDDSQTSDDGGDNSIFSDDESTGGSGETNENNKVQPGFGALMAIFILAGIYVFGIKR